MNESGPKTVESFTGDILRALEHYEAARRDYFPGIVPRLRERFAPAIENLEAAGNGIAAIEASPDQNTLKQTLLDASRLCLDALKLSIADDVLDPSLVNFRKAGRRIHRALEMLLPLCPVLPAVNRYFLEPAVHGRASHFLAGPEPGSPSGLFYIGPEGDPYARGSFSLHVPENPDRSKSLPLVVALHGGFGHGRDFIWTWLREARSREFLLAAPSSRGITWTITGQDYDLELLQWVLETIRNRWNVDRERILLTGLSDGATYALKHALDKQTPFTHFAIVSGLLAPFDLTHAGGRNILWVHGAKDWMFPAWRAKTGEKELAAAGADVTLEIVDDLYHAHPREKNDRILTWSGIGL